MKEDPIDMALEQLQLAVAQLHGSNAVTRGTSAVTHGTKAVTPRGVALRQLHQCWLLVSLSLAE